MRVKKDGAAGAAAGMGNGPLAADNAWTGGKVHVDAIGSRPPHKKRIKPSFHKSLEKLFENYGCGQISKGRKRHDVCPAGQHRHNGADYCHPEGQQHRGGASVKPDKPKGKRGRPGKPCEAGEHRHEGADFCHPENRKHRGMQAGFKSREEVAHRAEEEEVNPKPKKGRGGKEKPPFPSPPKAWKAYQALKSQLDGGYERAENGNLQFVDGETDPEKRTELDKKVTEARNLYYHVTAWWKSNEGEAWKKKLKLERIGAQGAKGRQYYINRIATLEQQREEASAISREARENYDEKREAAAQARGGDHRGQWTTEVKEAYAKYSQVAMLPHKLQASIKRARSQAGIAVAKDWIAAIPKLTGGVEAQIDGIRIGSKAYAHYSLGEKIIGVSEQALATLDKLYENPELLWGEAAKTYGFALGALFHEFLHSVNPAVGAGGYIKYGVTQAFEEGLTEAISNRMVAQPKVVSALIGKDVSKGAHAEPSHPDYIRWAGGCEALAEMAAIKHHTTPEWFLGKWKFHIKNQDRYTVISQDAGVADDPAFKWGDFFQNAKDKLPELRHMRIAQNQAEFKKALEPLWGILIPGFPLEGEISRGRVYVHEGEQAPEGTPTQQGPRGGTYYEAEPHFKQGDLVAIKDMFSGKQGNEEAIFQGMQDGENPNAIVEIQSPYGNQTKFVDPQDLVFLAPGHHPDKGQKERREHRQAQALGEVVTQFANTFRKAEKLEWNILLHQEAGGKWVREELVRGERDDMFERYRTDDGIEVFVPQDERKASALSLNRLLNYVSKMPPLAVQDLRKSVKRIILSPRSYAGGDPVWGTMNRDGDLTIYPNTKNIKDYSAGGFHGPNDIGLPDLAVARVLTHETGHAVENRVEELRHPYYDKRREFWEAYEKAGGVMPADDENILKIQRENGFPDPPTEEWWAGYGDMKELDRARYNPTEPKIPTYNIPAAVRGMLPKLHRPEPLHDANDIYAWNDLPPKVKLAMLEKIHRAKPVTGYAETNRSEYYAEAYEQFRYGLLPSDHILYKHFEELPKIEAFVNMPEIHITKVWHRHGPADWNNDEGTYHAHENAEKGHEHTENGGEKGDPPWEWMK